MDMNITTIKAAQGTAFITLLKNFAKKKYTSTVIPMAQADLTAHMSKMTDLAVRKGLISNTAFSDVTAYVETLYVEPIVLTEETLAAQILEDVEGLRVTMTNADDQASLVKIMTLTEELNTLHTDLVTSFTPAAKVAMEQFNTLCSESNLGE